MGVSSDERTEGLDYQTPSNRGSGFSVLNKLRGFWRGPFGTVCVSFNQHNHFSNMFVQATPNPPGAPKRPPPAEAEPTPPAPPLRSDSTAQLPMSSADFAAFAEFVNSRFGFNIPLHAGAVPIPPPLQAIAKGKGKRKANKYKAVQPVSGEKARRGVYEQECREHKNSDINDYNGWKLYAREMFKYKLDIRTAEEVLEQDQVASD